jgi:PAS domain S-box-containing protein
MIDITKRKQAEDTALRSEKQLRDLIETIPIMVFSMLPDGSTEFASRNWQDYTGLSLEDTTGDRWQATVHPDDLDTHLNKRHTSLASGQPFENEVRHRNAKGEYRWFLVRAVPLRDEHGNILKWYGVLTDIEDRKRAEQARQEIEEQWKAAFESNPTMYFIVDVAGGIVSVNAFGAEQLGYTVSELVGQSVLNLFYEPDRRSIQRHANACFEQPGRMMTWEARKIRKDGTMLWVRETANAVFLKKRPVLLVICEDITEQKRAEELLRESEGRFRTIFENAGSGVALMDPQGRAIKCNPAFTKMLGFTEGELRRMVFTEFTHPDDIEMDWRRYRELADRKRDRYEIEKRFIKKDGRVIWGRLTVSRVHNTDGALPDYMVAMTEDISERKRAEQALQRSESYLAEAQRMTKAGSWAYNPFTWKTIYWSDEMFRIIGVEPQTGLPTREDIWERVHPEDRDHVKKLASRGAREKVVHVIDYRLALPGGSVKYIHSIRHPVLNDAGEVVEVMGTSMDVTEQKRAEEELRAAETRFRTYVDHATDALFVHDAQGNILDMNQQACESLGYTREELIGKYSSHFDRGLDETSIHRLIERLEPGDFLALESTHQRKDGSMFPVEVRIRPFLHAGHLFRLSLARDISERKRAEQERERLRQLEADLAHINRVSMMGELTASLAHEIRQPIAAVISSADVCLRWLTRNPPNLERARSAVTRVKDDGTRAAEVINHLRSFYTKAEPPERELVDVNEVAHEMLILLRTEATRYSISMRTELAAGLPKTKADRVQLQQVFMNLMLNGIEAMKDTPGELTIKSERTDDDQLLISVSDIGVGLPAEGADQIFDAFYTTKPQGTGMGLAITRSIVESHGGRLWATANRGRGATFNFTLSATGEVDA